MTTETNSIAFIISKEGMSPSLYISTFKLFLKVQTLKLKETMDGGKNMTEGTVKPKDCRTATIRTTLENKR